MAVEIVRAAEADGFAYAKRLTDKAKVKETLKEFVKFKGPAFLEVMIDMEANVFPMVGPGMSYREMQTGEFIARREMPEAPASGEEIDMTKIPDLF